MSKVELHFKVDASGWPNETQVERKASPFGQGFKLVVAYSKFIQVLKHVYVCVVNQVVYVYVMSVLLFVCLFIYLFIYHYDYDYYCYYYHHYYYYYYFGLAFLFYSTHFIKNLSLKNNEWLPDSINLGLFSGK